MINVEGLTLEEIKNKLIEEKVKQRKYVKKSYEKN